MALTQNVGAMIDAVGRKTTRPDLEDDILDAINNAIALCVVRGDFANDLVEGTLTIDDTVYSQNLVIATEFTRYRKMKYLKPTDYTRYLDWVDPAKAWNGDIQCADVWYRAGLNIIINLSVLSDELKYGYYQYYARYDSTETAETHWMLDQMWETIFNLACGEVFEGVGNSEEGTRHTARGLKFLEDHISDKRDGHSG